MLKIFYTLTCILFFSFSIIHTNETALIKMSSAELEKIKKQKQKEAYNLINKLKITKEKNSEYSKILSQLKFLRKEIADITIIMGKNSFEKNIQNMMRTTNTNIMKNQKYIQKILSEKVPFNKLWQTVNSASVKTASTKSFYYNLQLQVISEWNNRYKRYYKSVLNNNPATFANDIKPPSFPLLFPPFNFLPADTIQKDLTEYIQKYSEGATREEARMFPRLIVRVVSITEITHKATRNISSSVPDDNPLSLPLIAPKYRFPKYYSINSLQTILNVIKTLQATKNKVSPPQLIYAEIDQKHIRDITDFLNKNKFNAEFVGCGKKDEKINFIALRNKIIDDGCQIAKQMLGEKYMDYINTREKGQKVNPENKFEYLNLIPSYKLFLRQKFNCAKDKEEQFKYAKKLIMENDIYALPEILLYLNSGKKNEVKKLLTIFIKNNFSIEQYHRILDELDAALLWEQNTQETNNEIEKLYLQVEEKDKKEEDKNW